MQQQSFVSRYLLGALVMLGALAALATLAPTASRAGSGSWFGMSWPFQRDHGHPGQVGIIEHQWAGEPGGQWHWVRSPEEERKTIMGLYNRYCIRCHGVDGRGVWDIPGVPDFTNPRFHVCRTDGQLVRAVLEGRGAVMPPFRGTLTLEEGWGMARYLRTFIPGAEKSKPDTGDNDRFDKEKDKGKDQEKGKGKVLPPPREQGRNP
jgi:mono/diheme cytochrome c family protein